MLIKSAEQISRISEDPDINYQNYMELISYINNLYDVINLIKPLISSHDSEFLPTFKGKYTCDKYNIDSTPKENELKVFLIKTTAFLEDIDGTKKEYLFDILENRCEKDSVVFHDDTIEFILI